MSHPPFIRTLAAMLLIVALWVAVFMAVLLLSAPARATSPHSEPIRERCDVIEVNSFYDGEGRLVFDQLIFWDWYGEESRYHVRAWRLVKMPGQIPERDHARDCWRSVFHDGALLRVVEAESVGRSWTQHDPEAMEREVLPANHRRGLIEPKAKAFP